MLQNPRAATFIISELLTENQQREVGGRGAGGRGEQIFLTEKVLGLFVMHFVTLSDKNLKFILLFFK